MISRIYPNVKSKKEACRRAFFLVKRISSSPGSLAANSVWYAMVHSHVCGSSNADERGSAEAKTLKDIMSRQGHGITLLWIYLLDYSNKL